MISWKNKKMKALTAALMMTLAMGALGCGGDNKAETGKDAKVSVGIVQLVEHAALDSANKGFVDGLAGKGFKEGQNITFDKQNAQADQSNLQNIAHRFVNNKVNLICAIATPPAQTVANVTSDIPIVATAVTDYEAAKLIKSNDNPGTNVTGTSDMNPVKEQLELLLKIAPNAKSVGTIYCSSEVNSQLQVDMLKAAAKDKNIVIKEATVSTVNDIQQAAHSLVGEVDALYIPTDNVMASAVPTLISVTDEAKLPVIAGEGSMVKAGCLATLGIDYYKLGVQTGEMAADILSGKAKPETMAIQHQKEFKATINTKAAEKIGLKLPEDVLKNAELVK